LFHVSRRPQQWGRRFSVIDTRPFAWGSWMISYLAEIPKLIRFSEP